MGPHRTNAGLDNISIFRKLHIFEQPGKQIMALATAGNLSISQSVVSTLVEGMIGEDGELETLQNAPTMFQAAQRITRAIRHVYSLEAAALEEADIGFEVSLLFGGQIKYGPLRLFNDLCSGPMSSNDDRHPLFADREHKYGKRFLIAL